MEQMSHSKNDSKKFRELLDRMEQKEDDTIFKRGISNHRWVSHFRSIFHDPGNQPLPKNTKLAGELDRDITNTEMKLAAYILRNG